jgi:hypothetical protein
MVKVEATGPSGTDQRRRPGIAVDTAGGKEKWAVTLRRLD